MISSLGKLIITFGIVLVLLGGLLLLFGKLPFFGKLPGDIYIQKKNFSIYFPLASSILLSLILSLLFVLFNIFSGNKKTYPCCGQRGVTGYITSQLR